MGKLRFEPIRIRIRSIYMHYARQYYRNCVISRVVSAVDTDNSTGNSGTPGRADRERLDSTRLDSRDGVHSIILRSCIDRAVWVSFDNAWCDFLSNVIVLEGISEFSLPYKSPVSRMLLHAMQPRRHALNCSAGTHTIVKFVENFFITEDWERIGREVVIWESGNPAADILTFPITPCPQDESLGK